MKVFQVEGDWTMDNVRVSSRPDPVPGRGQMRVAMRAAAINYRDLLVPLRGYGQRMKALPLIMLCDGVGIVESVGPEVTRFRVGERVCPLYFPNWLAGPPDPHKMAAALGSEVDGTMAEFMVGSEDSFAAPPASLDDEEAATLPTAALTAWRALVTEGRIGAGDSVLIQGTGGVALFAIQIARMHGARVIVTSSSDDKLERARQLGADEGINYREVPEWGRRVRDLTQGEGVDQVIELGGENTLPQSLRAVRTGGTISMIGVLSGGKMSASLGQVVTRHVRLQGITVGNRDDFEAMSRAMARHGTRPCIDRVFAFDEMLDALEHLRSGRHFGKIAIRF
jgi:NADPH:quinone reductase-like Zn-dependent oxidoreductase